MADLTNESAHRIVIVSNRQFLPKTYPTLMENLDIHLFSEDALRKQLETAESKLGYKLVHFYVDSNGILSKTPTNTTAQFYLSPSGGTLRDTNFNLVTYSARYDMYKGLGRL
ncbi:MAG: hypothetical protein MUF71_17035 [Candidatus Kapabacteria bacterium]|jgi:hypothetical protein|nr:hypothetical protein [Candidatus Kapabacteria bacterium]